MVYSSLNWHETNKKVFFCLWLLLPLNFLETLIIQIALIKVLKFETKLSNLNTRIRVLKTVDKLLQ